jgi:hypothetical protein
MKTITVNELAAFVKKAQKKVLGDKKILISADDEGNEYHELFFGFTDNLSEMLSGVYPPTLHGVEIEEAIRDYVILG